MPISTAASSDGSGATQCSRQLGCAGFTLLELGLVLLIMSVVMALTIPRLRDPGRAELIAQSRRLVMTFRVLQDEAVLNGLSYRLFYDIDQQRYWVVPDAAADLAEFADSIGALARGTRFEQPVGIADIVLPTLGGKISQGQIYTVFYPDGSVDPTIIHLVNGRDAYTLWVNPMNGKLKMDAGYHDVAYSG